MFVAIAIGISLAFVIHNTIMGRPGLLARLQDASTKFMFGAEKAASSVESFSQLKDKLIDGTEVSMSTFVGDVLCVVNVASK
mmetsp:Transcript_16802/g.23002  ORF Transcript_16802/g.23002 Transcript_16802/m.23002 type:complete len:82 (-) Transcript_16802:807-1052(-)